MKSCSFFDKKKQSKKISLPFSSYIFDEFTETITTIQMCMYVCMYACIYMCMFVSVLYKSRYLNTYIGN